MMYLTSHVVYKKNVTALVITAIHHYVVLLSILHNYYEYDVHFMLNNEAIFHYLS